MKILYGIQSTGNGHFTRSSKIIGKLIKSGCHVDIITSGNNSQINFPFPIKRNFRGLTFYYDGKGEIDYTKTFFELKFFRLLKDIKMDISDYDLIISDYEPITAWAAEFQNKISIGISNQCSFLSKNTPRPKKKEFLGEFLLKWMAPVKYPIGLHFDKYDQFIKPPILRDSLIGIEPKNLGHYTVYLSNWRYEFLVKHLIDFDVKFDVFTNIKKPTRFKNCFLKPIGKKLFDESLINSEGVITTGGFQTCAESIYLNKKLIVLPIGGQYEQLCNAESLKGLGAHVGEISDIEGFMSNNNQQIYHNIYDSTDEIVKEILNFRFK